MQRFRQHLLRGAATAAALCTASWSTHAFADQPTYTFDLPRQPLARSLRGYAEISGQQIIFTSDVVDDLESPAVHGAYTADAALAKILQGSNLTTERSSSGALMVERPSVKPVQIAQAGRKPKVANPGVETVVVTAQKKSEDIQSVPIAVSAFSQKDLKERQVATGGDLIRETPNMNFGKTNFSGYSIELRGIGTQAISVTTDPAVAVAFNGIPFIRNHFFEQEFFDVESVEVLRGPQGTLWGRNATAGVVNIVAAKPTDEAEVTGSVDIGNYNDRRVEGMINLPIVGDKLDLRIAGEWTKRDGYSFDTITNKPIDGRDLWSGRASLRWRPTQDLDFDLVWEHFAERDGRMRSAKQLCHTAPIPNTVDGVSTSIDGPPGGTGNPTDYLSQGCEMSSLYSKDAFQVPNGYSLAYYSGLSDAVNWIRGNFNVYGTTTQSTNLRNIQSTINPVYKANNDTIAVTADYQVTPTLSLTSQTGYSSDFLWSTEDYNRFNSAPGAFINTGSQKFFPDPGVTVCDNLGTCTQDAAIFCDPQLGCSDRLVAQDLNDEHAWQASQEFRLASNLSGPLNFSVGTSYLHYETEENYYVFINTLTAFTAPGGPNHFWALGQPGFSPMTADNSYCLAPGYQFKFGNPTIPSSYGTCRYIDPNPISSVNGQGRNYFLNQNPYVLNSYAGFGEVYYNVTPDLKLTGGLRWTDDRKHFVEIPSELLIGTYGVGANTGGGGANGGYGYPSTGILDQQWDQFTGRAVVDWTPQFAFTDQTLIYGSYAHGYKAGGANPPGATFFTAPVPGAQFQVVNPIHPQTFKPEHIEALELGTKNSLLDDTLTLNADVFYYNYHGYQISRIVDRSAINDNFNAHIVGAELESTWEPLSGLKFNFAGGYENARLAKGTSSIDLIDRTAGNPNWIVVKPVITNASNCILPTYVVAELLQYNGGNNVQAACVAAYSGHLDPLTNMPYTPNPAIGYFGSPLPTLPGGQPYPGFDPVSANAINNGAGPAPNNGAGFSKNLSGNQLPNAPPFTLSFGAQYTMPVFTGWAATLRGDFYWQGNTMARVFNDRPYDELHGYTNLNLALILNSSDGWQVMGYVKNVFNTTAITGDFLNSDDSGLTTNVFLTDPRLFGIRVTKDFAEGSPGGYGIPEFLGGIFSDSDGGRPTLWIELGGGFDRLNDGQQIFSPPFMSAITQKNLRAAMDVQGAPRYALDEEAKVSWQPDGSDWIFSGAVRYGRTSANRNRHHQTANAKVPVHFTSSFPTFGITKYHNYTFYPTNFRFAGAHARQSESHAMFDFLAGKDIGLGMFGLQGSSTVSGGIRVAQFTSKSNVSMGAQPDVHYPSAPITSKYELNQFKNPSQPFVFHDYFASAKVKRDFLGIGPELSWDASQPVLGQEDRGEVAFDWGANFALLFGRQKARGHHQTTSKINYAGGSFQTGGEYGGVNGGRNKATLIGRWQVTRSVANYNAADFDRSRVVVVPDLGGFVGASVKYRNAMISFGYRADVFFGAMDGGIDAPRSENRSFFGPFAHISIGFGG